jgi:hypothetical protein
MIEKSKSIQFSTEVSHIFSLARCNRVLTFISVHCDDKWCVAREWLMVVFKAYMASAYRI